MTLEVQARKVTLTRTPATLYTIFLPLKHNDGRVIQPVDMHWAQMEILHYASGLTRFSPCIGFWIENPKVYRDLILPIQVALPPGPEAEAWFVRHASKMASVFEQKQIFLLAQSVSILEFSLEQLPVKLGGSVYSIVRSAQNL